MLAQHPGVAACAAVVQGISTTGHKQPMSDEIDQLIDAAALWEQSELDRLLTEIETLSELQAEVMVTIA